MTTSKDPMDELLATLTKREERVIRLRIGLDDRGSRTLEEISKELGVPQERIQQVEAKALRKLRPPAPVFDL